MYNTIINDRLDYLKTPCYIIDENKFEDNLKKFKEKFFNQWGENIIFGYSIKTNHNINLMKLAKENKMYAEAVSDDEYHYSLFSGFQYQNIIYNGPQKSEKLLLEALSHNGIINIDNLTELKIIKDFKEAKKEIKAQIGLRINFDLEKECCGETTAGNEVSRFGICIENGDFGKAVQELKKMDIPINGLHLHYSSKTRSKKVFESLAKKAVNLITKFDLIKTLKYIDVGGGFFLGENTFSKDKPTLQDYAITICNELKKVLNPNTVSLILEPGASLIASSVEYYTRIINEREIRNAKILTVDGTILHINPFMVDRKYEYEIISKIPKSSIYDKKQILCGATCMENDRFFSILNLFRLEKGDIIKFKYAGAYTMGFNNYFINTPPYVYVYDGDSFSLVKDKLNWYDEKKVGVE